MPEAPSRSNGSRYDRVALVRHAEQLHGRNFNCAQAVACTLATLHGADEDGAFRLAEALGGGLGGHTETCGALLGGAMAIGQANSRGCADPTSKLETYELVKQLVAAFRERFGTTVCDEIRAQDESGQKPLPICKTCIATAVELTADVLEGMERD